MGKAKTEAEEANERDCRDTTLTCQTRATLAMAQAQLIKKSAAEPHESDLPCISTATLLCWSNELELDRQGNG